MPSITATRNVSGPFAVEAMAVTSDQNTPTSWARPNPHSLPNSKTSQYIDKITSENDRLRRELKAEKLAREDEAKRVSAAQSRTEESRAEFDRLQILANTNSRALERKDRKLEELRTTVEAETRRRKLAEQRAEEALKMLGDTRSETQRELAKAYEMRDLADTNLKQAHDGFKRMTEGYEKKVKLISESLNELRRQRLEDSDKIKRQDIISEQLQHEMSRMIRAESKCADLMSIYKEEHRKELDALVEEAQRMRLSLPEKENAANKLIDDLEQTRDKMQWVMTQHIRQQQKNGT